MDGGSLILLGDWKYKEEAHRVFGCQFEGRIESYDINEILDIVWLAFDGVVDFAEAGQFHTGFELEAITAFRGRRRFR